MAPPTRAFHASAPRKDPVLDAILYLPHEMMTLIHTQVPWYAAIPASAFLLRAALVTSFGTWARSLMARYIGLQPLRQALARQKRDDVLKQIDRDGLTLDLAGVEESDSTALSLLLECTRAAKALGFRIAFANLPENLRTLADVYGVLELIAIDAAPAGPGA